MEKTVRVFLIIGLVLSIVLIPFGIYFAIGSGVKPEFKGLAATSFIYGGAGIVCSIAGMISVESGSKNKVLGWGIANLVFVFIVTGILMIVYSTQLQNYHSYSSGNKSGNGSYENSQGFKGVDKNDKKLIYDSLKRLYDQGSITKEQFEERITRLGYREE